MSEAEPLCDECGKLAHMGDCREMEDVMGQTREQRQGIIDRAKGLRTGERVVGLRFTHAEVAATGSAVRLMILSKGGRPWVFMTPPEAYQIAAALVHSADEARMSLKAVVKADEAPDAP